MKIQLGKTARVLPGRNLIAEPRYGSDVENGITVRVIQDVERNTKWGTNVLAKRVAIELDLGEAEKLARDLLDAAKCKRGRQYKEKLAARSEREHCCIHCGHGWTGTPDEPCPKRIAGDHPTGPHTLTDAEMNTLGPNGLSWIEEPHGVWRPAQCGDWRRTDVYDRDVLNSLQHRGLIEWADDQTNWRPTSVGVFVVQEDRKRQ